MRWRTWALPILTHSILGDLNSPYGVNPDEVIIRPRQSVKRTALISNKMALQQGYLVPIDTILDGEEMMNISQAFIALTVTEMEFTETGQHRRGQPPQLPPVPCFTKPVHLALCDIRHQHQHPSTGPAFSQNVRSHIRKERPRRIRETLRYFPLLPSCLDGDGLGHERIVRKDINFRLVLLSEVVKA